MDSRRKREGKCRYAASASSANKNARSACKGFCFARSLPFFPSLEKNRANSYDAAMTVSDKVKALLLEFTGSESIQAVEAFCGGEDNSNETINLIARMFGAADDFDSKYSGEAERKLLASFKSNLTLLTQKTWVEKSDLALKEQILFELENFCANDASWKSAYAQFLEIIANAVYLMFGQQTRSTDFVEYSLRIDPKFGMFWAYIQSLPRTVSWSEDKCRNAVLLGMFFLANY